MNEKGLKSSGSRDREDDGGGRGHCCRELVVNSGQRNPFDHLCALGDTWCLLTMVVVVVVERVIAVE